jgi:hypothetical protein
MMVEARRTHKKHIISSVFTILYHVPFDESLARQPVITKPTGSNLKLRVVLTSRVAMGILYLYEKQGGTTTITNKKENQHQNSLAAASRLLLGSHDRKGLAFRLGRVLGKLFGDFYKESLDVISVLGRCFQMKNSVFFCIGICLFKFYLAPGFQIGLVSSQSNYNIGISTSLQFFHPRFGSSKGIGVSDIVNDNCSSCTSVIHWCQRAVAFLSRSVL